MSDQERAGPIQPPDNFPVAWADPEDEKLHWNRDRTHFPDPLPPLEADFWFQVFQGGNREDDREKTHRLRMQCFNGYLYMCQEPLLPPEEMEGAKKRAEEQVEVTMGEMDRLWEEEWLPEIHSHLEFWNRFDLEGAEMSELVAHLEETWERLGRLWYLHFQIVHPAYEAMGKLNTYYRELFEESEAFDAARLYQGLDNKTLEMGRALWALSRETKADPDVRRVFEEEGVADIPEALEALTPGRAFLEALDTYLETYGQRGDMWGIRFPSWIEDPTPVIKNLKDYLDRDRDPEAELAELAAEREEAVAGVRERLKGYPKPSVERFEFLLKTAQVGVVLSEDHGFWIDFTASYRVRRVLMEFGRRFAGAGAIETPEDVFYIKSEELIETAAALPGADLRDRVTERRAERAHFWKIDAPQLLGTKEEKKKKEGEKEKEEREAEPDEAEEPGLLKGNSGSPGKARGPARVIRSIEEGNRLRPGDVLVAETTAPSWTPLFVTAAAVVTETGGILSHCAVVAREYRIPAVVGVDGAISKIEEGQVLEVDGDAGRVRIVEGD